MGQKVIKIRKPVSPSDVYVHVACTITEKPFRFSLNGATTNKYCRHCGKESFVVDASPIKGHLVLDVSRLDEWSQRHDVPENDFTVEIDES